MKQLKPNYTNEPLGKIKVIPDFLPAPEKLILKIDTVKITLSLTKNSVSFFKTQARKHHTQYQKMLRTLIDEYASKYA